MKIILFFLLLLFSVNVYSQCDKITNDPYHQSEMTTVVTKYVVQVGSFINPPMRLHKGLKYYMERCSNKYIVEDIVVYSSKIQAKVAVTKWLSKGYKGSFIKEQYYYE